MQTCGNSPYGQSCVYGSLACEIPLFDEREAGEYSAVTARKQKIKRKRRAGASPALAVSCALCLIIMLSALYGSLQITVLSSEVQVLRQEIELLSDEQAKLKIEYARLYSPTETEAYAREILGMDKPGAHQIIYLDVDKPIVFDDVKEEKSQSSFVDCIRAYFSG